MSNCASRAEFTGTGGTSRSNARIFARTNASFKSDCTAADVESSGHDEAGNPSPGGPRAARRILAASGLQIDAELVHGALWHETRMRARCADGSWSNWIIVAK